MMRVAAVLFLWVLSSVVATAGDERYVSSREELETALLSARAGDVIVFENGVYRLSGLRFDAEGQPDRPVTLRAESPGGVIFTADAPLTESLLLLTGKHLIVSGFTFRDIVFEGNLLRFSGAEDVRLTGCRFERLRGHDRFWRVITLGEGGHSNTIDHCVFENNEDTQTISIRMTPEGPVRNTWIHRNVFRNLNLEKREEGTETIQVGNTTHGYSAEDRVLSTLVEKNHFENIGGDMETISNKTNRNVFRNNVLRRCRQLVIRGGFDCVVEGNRLIDSDGHGIRIYGGGHLIENNVIRNPSGSGIALAYGLGSGRDASTHRLTATDCIIRNNTIIEAGEYGISLGEGRGTDYSRHKNRDRWTTGHVQDDPPVRNVISDNRIRHARLGAFDHAEAGNNLILRNEEDAGVVKALSSADPSAPPNIILIMADDFGLRAFEQHPTPELDRMAREGVSFEFAQSTPLCTPSRVQIMTGKYNFRNYTGFGELRPGETTFAHVLKSVGYRTCIVGKWQLGGNAYAPYGFGFDDYCLWQLTFGGYHERYHNPRIIRNGEVTKYSNGEYGPRIFTDHLLDFVDDARDDRPFFVYFPMALPHRPITPTPDTPGYRELVGSKNQEVESDPRFFEDQVRYLDRLVGEILGRLRESGQAENTLVLFTTDNGTGDEIGVDLEGREVPGQKGNTNLLGTHVPLLAWWPGSIAGGGRTDRLVDFTDVLPTLAEAAGAALPEDFIVDGISFLPQLLGRPGAGREWVFCHYDPGKEKFPVSRFVYNREWKLYDDGRVYRIAEDPLEEIPLDISSAPSAARSLLSRFESVLLKLR